MIEFFTKDDDTDPAVAKAFSALADGAGTHHIVVRARDPGELAQIQHDVAGAVRSFKYLADKVRASYAGDARGDKVLASIAKHLATLEMLKRDLVDRLVPADEGGRHGNR